MNYTPLYIVMTTHHLPLHFSLFNVTVPFQSFSKKKGAPSFGV